MVACGEQVSRPPARLPGRAVHRPNPGRTPGPGLARILVPRGGRRPRRTSCPVVPGKWLLSGGSPQPPRWTGSRIQALAARECAQGCRGSPEHTQLDDHARSATAGCARTALSGQPIVRKCRSRSSPRVEEGRKVAFLPSRAQRTHPGRLPQPWPRPLALVARAQVHLPVHRFERVHGGTNLCTSALRALFVHSPRSAVAHPGTRARILIPRSGPEGHGGLSWQHVRCARDLLAGRSPGRVSGWRAARQAP